MAGGVAAGAAILLPRVADQGADVLARAPAYAQSIVVWEHGWSRYYERLRLPPQLRRDIDQSARSAGEAAATSARTSLVALAVALSNLPWLILIPILAFFLLKDAACMRRAALSVLPRALRLRGHRLFQDLNAALAAYIRAQLLACALVGGLCGIGFAILGIPYPALLRVLAGVLEFIPLVGPLVAAAAAALVAGFHSPMLALAAIGFLAVLRVVEDYVIYPRLIRRGLELHPLAVIVAVLAGAELNGIAGVFLAVPTAAIASVVCRHWFDWEDRTIGPSARTGPVPFSTR
jgi:predicted PurR-regulated permease PerM